MFVRNFFTKAVADHTGCFAFFTGSVLDVEAHFRACFTNNFFYLKIDESLFSKPFIRVRYFPTNSGVVLLAVEVYNFDSGLYEPTHINDKDKAFLRHVMHSCSAVLIKAEGKWRDKIEKMEDIPF